MLITAGWLLGYATTAPTRSDAPSACSSLVTTIPNGQYKDSFYTFCLGETYWNYNYAEVSP